MHANNMIALIDIGSAETKVLLARFTPDIEILGSFTAPTHGLIKGEIVDISMLKESVHDAIRGAENAAELKLPLRFACLSLTGPHVSGTHVRGLASVKSERHIVEESDIEDARADAYARRIPDGRTVVHRIRRDFTLDGRPLKNPAGSIGTELAYNLWLVDAEIKYLTELIQIPNQYGMRVEEIFAASLAAAAALAVGGSSDKDRLVIDIGEGTTDYIFYRDGVVELSGIIPVGGRHITSDISTALQISMEDAEWVKLNKARATVSDADLDEEFLLPGTEPLGDLAKRFSAFKTRFATSLRVREIFELIRKKIGSDFIGVVQLTGGTSLLPEIAKVAAEVFETEASLCAPEHDYAKRAEMLTDSRDGVHPKYSAVVGMAELLHRIREERLQISRRNNLWERLKTALFSH